MTAAEGAAWSVHAYTAFGAVLGFLGLEAVARGNYRLAFLWMAVATLIDCTDGYLARRMRVKEVLPHFDGARLDDIVDYLNYVVVPIVLLYHAGCLPHGVFGMAIASLPLLASAYGFCQTAAKTADHFFQGFPSYWNIVALYLVVLQTPRWFNVACLTIFSVLVFVPIRYLYPSRNPIARRTTHTLGVLWALAVVWLIVQLPAPARWLAWLSLLFPLYYVAASFIVHFGTPRTAT